MSVRPAKAAMARRLVEVLQMLDDLGRPATVKEICQRGDWPDSSIRDLLVAMVECGLLYRNERTHTFQPTPRAALLGGLHQPAFIRDGRLVQRVDALAAQTGLDMAVLGMVDAEAQVFWRVGRGTAAAAAGNGGVAALVTGAKVSLAESAAGWLMLATLTSERRAGLLRRLNAVAGPERAFRPAEVEARVASSRRDGFVHGPAGFGDGARMCAVLAPGHPGGPPLVVGFVLRPCDRVDPVWAAKLLRSRLDGLAVADDVADPRGLPQSCANTDAAVVADRCERRFTPRAARSLVASGGADALAAAGR